MSTKYLKRESKPTRTVQIKKNKYKKPDTKKQKPVNKHLKRTMVLIKELNDVQSCVLSKCQKQKEEYENKQKKNIEKIGKLVNKLITSKTPSQGVIDEIRQTKIKLIKSQEKRKIVECQIHNCYKQTAKMLNTSLQVLLDKSVPVNKKTRALALKYKKIFSKGKIRPIDITNSDVDFTKVKK